MLSAAKTGANCSTFMTKLIHYPEQYSAASSDIPYGISSGCVVYKNDDDGTQVLLLMRNRDNKISYHLPKGTVHVDESLEQAAIRETAEEAGIKVDLVTYLGAKVYQYEFKGKYYDKTFHYYAAEYIKDLGGMDNEHDGKIWINIDEAADLLDKTSPDKKESVFVGRLISFLESKS